MGDLPRGFLNKLRCMIIDEAVVLYQIIKFWFIKTGNYLNKSVFLLMKINELYFDNENYNFTES